MRLTTIYKYKYEFELTTTFEYKFEYRYKFTTLHKWGIKDFSSVGRMSFLPGPLDGKEQMVRLKFISGDSLAHVYMYVYVYK